jgi:hypothetical protein
MYALREDTSCPRTLTEAVSTVFVYLAFAYIEYLQCTAVTVTLGWLMESSTGTCLASAIK